MPGSQVSQASQELRQTLIPCPGGYVALPELESCIARRRSLANEQPHQAEQRATASQAKVPVARLGHSQQAIASAARPAASKSNKQSIQQQGRLPANQTHNRPRGKQGAVDPHTPESQSDPQHHLTTTTFTSNSIPGVSMQILKGCLSPSGRMSVSFNKSQSLSG
ncbi:hypothetical protein CDL15_Pgr020838 [Punica granatum]|uniref:Uncharacterized protein n=1 Tax=Punica granatum TaxID=22663 RepID=A0A218XV97_PUNGR|nr:hypothetical protein CDL15_Pgr020838 [Punica granatum]